MSALEGAPPTAPAAVPAAVANDDDFDLFGSDSEEEVSTVVKPTPSVSTVVKPTPSGATVSKPKSELYHTVHNVLVCV